MSQETPDPAFLRLLSSDWPLGWPIRPLQVLSAGQRNDVESGGGAISLFVGDIVSNDGVVGGTLLGSTTFNPPVGGFSLGTINITEPASLLRAGAHQKGHDVRTMVLSRPLEECHATGAKQVRIRPMRQQPHEDRPRRGIPLPFVVIKTGCGFQNLRTGNAVAGAPEPGSLALLLGLGTAGAGLFRRRRRLNRTAWHANNASGSAPEGRAVGAAGVDRQAMGDTDRAYEGRA